MAGYKNWQRIAVVGHPHSPNRLRISGKSGYLLITCGASVGNEGAIVTNAGTVTYQWQKALAASPMKFTNVTVNGTSASLVLAGQLAANTGDKYRVVVASNNGADRKTSTAVALTFGTGA